MTGRPTTIGRRRGLACRVGSILLALAVLVTMVSRRHLWPSTRVDWLRNVLASGRATIQTHGERHTVAAPQVIPAAPLCRCSLPTVGAASSGSASNTS